MKRLLASVAALVALVVLPLGGSLTAQGVTTAAVVGRLTDESGSPVGEATVALLNTSTGQTWSTRAAADGRFAFENVAVGGPYTVDVRAVGFEPLRVTGVLLRLGQRLVFDRQLKR